MHKIFHPHNIYNAFNIAIYSEKNIYMGFGCYNYRPHKAYIYLSHINLDIGDRDTPTHLDT